MGPGEVYRIGSRQALQQAQYAQQAYLQQQQQVFGANPFAKIGGLPGGMHTYTPQLGDYLLERNRQVSESLKHLTRARKYRRDVHDQWWHHGVRVSWVDVRRELCPVCKRAHLRKVARKRWKVVWRWWRANWRWIL